MSVEETKAFLEELAAVVYQPPLDPPPEATPEAGAPAGAQSKQQAPSGAGAAATGPDPVAAGTITKISVDL